MDTYQGTIFDPISLHKYLYANANPVMYTDPSGYFAENDIDFYKQAWLTIDQAIEYEQQLIGSLHNQVAYDYNVMQIGREIIRHLRNTGLEMAITAVLTPYIGPDIAKLVANGVVKALDLANKFKKDSVNSFGFIDDNGTLQVGRYEDVKGHHVYAKAAFKSSSTYDKNKGFSISNQFMLDNGIDHGKVTGMQHTLFNELAKSGRDNTLGEHMRIAYESLKAGGASDELAGTITALATVDMLLQNVTSPTHIPWN